MQINQYLIQNFVARVCLLVSTFLVNLLFANLLNAAGSGELYYTINNFSIITLLASLSLESGNTYFLSKKEIANEELTTLSLLWPFISSLLATLLLVLVESNGAVHTRYATPFYTYVFIAGSLLTTYFSSLFFGQQNFVWPHLIPAISNFLVTICGGIIFLAGKEKTYVDSLITIYFLSYFVNGLVLCLIYYSRFSSGTKWRWPSWHNLNKLLKYSLLAFITNIIAFLAYRIDYWILKSFSPEYINESALGNYIQVSKLVQVFLVVPTIIATVVFPTTAAGITPEFHNKFNKIVKQAFLLNIAVCGFVVILGKWLFTFLYGPSFSQMYSCFLYSIPAILAITVVRILTSYFAGINKIKYNLIGGLIALIVITVLNHLLIPSMGINGSAMADSAGYISYMSFLLVLFAYKRKQPV
jgi:O-antigen/teichoic acid export membrane protein